MTVHDLSLRYGEKGRGLKGRLEIEYSEMEFKMQRGP